jgi:NADH:ubiquinone oxidoreductase subunit B-like Fe-S oxidoreductase
MTCLAYLHHNQAIAFIVLQYSNMGTLSIIFAASPGQADIMIVAGYVTNNVASAVRLCYHQWSNLK